jgi:hypothetical protein
MGLAAPSGLRAVLFPGACHVRIVRPTMWAGEPLAALAAARFYTCQDPTGLVDP